MTDLVFERFPNGEYGYLRPERKVRVTDSTLMSPAVEARALAMLSHYLERATDRTEAEEIIARDAYMAAYRAGYRAATKDTFEACANLAAVTDQFERAADRVERLIRAAA